MQILSAVSETAIFTPAIQTVTFQIHSHTICSIQPKPLKTACVITMNDLCNGIKGSQTQH